MRRVLQEYDEVAALLVTGGIAVLCLFVVPVVGFGPEFLGPEGQRLSNLRGGSALFALTYGIGLLSSVLCLVLVVTVVFPREWVDAD